ncbi:unnamed protein product [Cyclocybe aegerita]|uniref:Uncharacterized protein n=1 Tax=Cyclocybe aegerita TaxID=1973307 RepID=A0A8S0X634_CYCAE|nr:unnamed protein product [Cyclocybe aegerita]
MSVLGARPYPPKSILKPIRRYASANPSKSLPNRQSSSLTRQSNSTDEIQQPSIHDELPQELIDTIIDFLHSDKVTLRNLTVVSRAWLPRARLHLLPKNIYFCLHAANVERVVGVLSSPIRTIGPYVRGLHLQIDELRRANPKGPVLADHDAIFQHKSQQVHLRDSLGIVAVACRSLNFLKLTTQYESPYPGPVDADVFIIQIRSFKLLTHLELDACVFGAFEEFLSVICAPRSLRALLVQNRRCWGWESARKTPQAFPSLRLPPRLSRLEVVAERPHLFFEWIQNTPVLPKITTLSLGGSENADESLRDASRGLLQALGPELKIARLFGWHWLDGADVSRWMNLQTLTISHFDLIVAGARMERLFKQLPASSLIKINFYFLLDDGADLDAVPWHWIARALNHPKFRNLKVLRFQGRTKGHELEVILREKFEWLDRKGVLSVKTKDRHVGPWA